MQANYNNKFKSSFNYNGFFQFENVFLKSDLKNLELNIYNFANQFSHKINSKIFKKKINNFSTFNQFCIDLESYNKDYFFNFTTLVANVFQFQNIIYNKKLMNYASIILNENVNNLLVQKPTLLINIPKNKRILYHWHNAKNSYPKRNKCLNLWFPILIDKSFKNGSMNIAEKSHVNEYPFLEFKGFSKDNKNALSQYLVPKEYFKDLKIKKIKAEVGSCLTMHPNLLHTSTTNLSNKCSYVVIFKIWSIGNDLTLSSNIQQKYFMNDNGAGPDVQKSKN
tara:strand:- start:622 stop:1461 length:840 start_codon:yes stop_codon:yes gene_type:complete